MAQIDFSNAVITHSADNWQEWLGLTSNYYYLRDENNQDIAGYVDRRIYTSGSLNSFYITYSGTFTRNGTKIIFSSNTASNFFTISNISYSAGDTFDFRIDISFTVE